MLLVLSLLSAAALAAAASDVTVSYPLDDQLPPIARIHNPFSWSFSPNTFLSRSEHPLTYSASALPAWLSFDPSTLTLSGTPDTEDEGTPKITITATADSNGESAASALDLCVTPYPPPELHIPIENQFQAQNPSLSSVFIVSNASALHSGRPAVRIPPKWSFSIGFDYNTFSADNNLYYSARQMDGSPLPDWVKFNARAMTFNGYTPSPDATNLSLPHVVSLALHASDQEGYSAASVSFDIIVAEHDFAFSKASSSNSLPTINVTASQPFELTLNSAVDFAGVVLDDQTVSPDNITALDIDISNLESWLRYDASTRTLSGEPPSDFNQAVLPTIITSSVNQTLNTQVTLAAVPSFFTDDELDPILVSPGTPLTFYLAQFFSNSSDLGNPGDIEFSASFDPPDAGNALHFDSSNSLLTGTVPTNVTYDHINVAFTAYSHITHSTSHTRLPISLSAEDYAHQKNKHGGLSTAARQKLLLGLKIGFGIVSAFIAIALFFAVMRRCGHVADTAVEGEEGRRAWTAEEMKWYGIGIEVNGERYTPSLKEVDALAARKSSEAPREGPMFGTALSRVLTRTPSNATRSPLSPVGLPISPPMVRKVEFMGRVRATARVVSDKYRRVVSGPRRPVISKPTLILTSDENAGGPSRRGGPILPTINPAALLGSGSRDFKPLDDTNFSQYAPSGPTSLADSSPTSSTDERSIPRRRADFAPPKAGLANPPAAHVDDADTRSVDSATSSLASNRTHEAEAVVQRATRATSVRSGASGFSLQVQAPVPGMPAAVETARPRLVPFTSATRVPVPKMPSSFFSPELDNAKSGEGRGEAAPGKTKRVASQMAKVFRGQQAQAAALPAAVSADELSTGIEYVRALGDDGRDSLAPSTAERSPVISFSSLESSNHGGPARVERVLARTGERFRFRVPVAHGTHTRGLETRLVSGRPLPRFIRADVAAAGVGITGVPTGGDAGVYEVGVFVRGGECVGRIIVEVVERKAA